MRCSLQDILFGSLFEIVTLMACITFIGIIMKPFVVALKPS